jgi:hypothetical protein
MVQTITIMNQVEILLEAYTNTEDLEWLDVPFTHE